MAEYLMPEKKQEIFAKYGKSNKDTGSPESQVALFSYRIAHLTEHVKKNKKDVPSFASSVSAATSWIIFRRRTSRDTGISSRSLVSADSHDRKTKGVVPGWDHPFFDGKDVKDAIEKQ